MYVCAVCMFVCMHVCIYVFIFAFVSVFVCVWAEISADRQNFIMTWSVSEQLYLCRFRSEPKRRIASLRRCSWLPRLFRKRMQRRLQRRHPLWLLLGLHCKKKTKNLVDIMQIVYEPVFGINIFCFLQIFTITCHLVWIRSDFMLLIALLFFATWPRVCVFCFSKKS